MPWVALGVAGASMLSGSDSAKKQRKAMERAQRQARIDLEKSLKEAKEQHGPYSEIGTRDGLYRLAALMGDDRFGSKEAMELYELKAPPGMDERMASPRPDGIYNFSSLVPPSDQPWNTITGVQLHPGINESLPGMPEGMRPIVQGEMDSEVAAYLKRKAELEAAIAKQKADGTYRKAGFDYITGTEAYKNRLNEGQRNMLRGMSANRGVLSGGALKDLEKYGQDYAANEYNQEFTRLSQLAGLGQQANTAIANAAMGQGTNLANLSLQGGTTLADYYNNQNNVTQGTLGNLAYLNERKRQSSYGGLNGR